LLEHEVPSDPFALFTAWMQGALDAGLRDATAMAVSTCSPDGRPSSRMILLKSHDPRGFVFFTRYSTQKGADLLANPRASLLFYWRELERQVRIEGRIEKVTAEESRAYYETRPLGARIGAWASPQSKVIENRAWLEKRWAELSEQYGEAPALPPHWGGYRVVAQYIEFWQGRRSRLHDRVTYTRQGEQWKLARLAP
jgi:pyridoxamine 5'-phosphate oxidase